jgi:acyl carrier protein
MTAMPHEDADQPSPEQITATLLGFINTEIMAQSRPLDGGANLEESGVDSMALLQVLLFIERTWGFWIPDHELTDDIVRTPRQLARHVCGKLAAGS